MNEDLRNYHYHLPYNPKLVSLAKELRKKQTPAEKKLWKEFFHYVNPRVLRQRPIDEFIVDFYCHSLWLVIEIDGETHFSHPAVNRDEQRTERLEELGLKVIRYTNIEVMNRFEGVCESLISQGLEWKE